MRIELFGDFQQAARVFHRNRGLAAVVVISLGVGIGGAASVFSVVDRILFRSLPFGASDRLVSVGIQAPVLPYDFLLGAGYRELRNHPPESVERVTSWVGVNDCDLTDGEPVRLSCAAVESTFLDTLGIVPATGRTFAPAEDAPQAPPVALISYGLWQARFGAKPDALQRVISLDGRPTRIVGVLPASFETPTLARADILVPQRLDDATLARAVTGRPLRVIARLKPRASAARLEAEGGAVLTAAFQEARVRLPGATDIAVRVRSIRDLQVGDATAISWLLFGTVLAVLLLSCANVTNLMLARSFSRTREMAIRQALGASWWQLARLPIAESVVLALVGGMAGIAFGAALLRIFVRLAPQGIPRLAGASLDLRTAVFAMACSLAAGIAIGLAPSFSREARPAQAQRGWLRPLLVVTQFALSLALLTGAALMGRALYQFQTKPLGMETQQVVTASLSLPLQRCAQAQAQLAFAEQLETRLQAAPGITVAAMGDSYPPNVPQRSRPAAVLTVDGARPERELRGPVVWRAVSTDYFRALGIRILRGRPFTDEDRGAEANVVILSDSLARRLFGGHDAVGHLMGITGLPGGSRIVGVAENVRNGGGTSADDPEYYTPRPHAASAGIWSAPNELRRMTAIVRTPLAANAAARALRQAVGAIDATVPVDIVTLAQSAAELSERPRFNAMLLAFFAAIGLALAAFGLYGVLGFMVAQRTREIGVRMALGATPGGIGRLVMTDVGRWLAAGLLCGFALSGALARALGSLLLGVSAADPAAWISAAGLLLICAAAAAWLPARRAARVDPMEALRHE